jgi:hypothetical protein
VFPSQKARTPLEATAPLQLSTRLLSRTAMRRITDRFTDSHAQAQLPRFPADYELPFSWPRGADLQVVLGSGSELASFSELHLLRSFIPFASPFSVDASCPTPTADTLLGLTLFRVFSHDTSKPQPARPPEGTRTRPELESPESRQKDLRRPKASSTPSPR